VSVKLVEVGTPLRAAMIVHVPGTLPLSGARST